MDDYDDVRLPEDTLKILNEFLLEKAQRENEERDRIETKAGNPDEGMFEEDWNLSQFWYSNGTKSALGGIVSEILKETPNAAIALLSCPSLYATIKAIHPNVKIFEFDKRFSAFGDDFVFYDFNQADSEGYLQEYEKHFDIILADPPFLSEECIQKVSKIIKSLQKDATKIIFCSGQVVQPWLQQYLDLRMCKFRPEHERNLGNEFSSYANFDLDSLVKS